MKQLTREQINFLVDNFFVHKSYPGSTSIGVLLLKEGECIVAGKECIWSGGIGNFITTEGAYSMIDCTKYKFDREKFLGSKLYLDVKHSILEDLRK